MLPSLGRRIHAGVLAATAIPRPDGPGTELGPTLGHLGKATQDDDSRNTNRAAWCAN